MLLYLDNCCLNRPFDEPSQPRIQAEAAAVLTVLDLIASGTHQLVASSPLLVEVRRNPDMERQTEILHTLKRLARIIKISETIIQRSHQLVDLGLKNFDALHVASFEASGVDYLLTTDDRLLRFAKRNPTLLVVKLENPLIWLSQNLP